MPAIHRCASCGATFKSSKAFNDHECVKALEDVPLEELMRRYQAQQARPKSSTTKQ